MTIISHSRKFIFLKSEKTAGTSILQSLGKHCAGEDIVCGTSRRYHRDYKDYSMNNSGFDIHMTSDAAVSAMQSKYKKCWKEMWNSYFKFTSIRNPWDQYVSSYCWTMAKRCIMEGRSAQHISKSIIMPDRPDFKDHFARHIQLSNSNNWEKYYFCNNLPVADFYIRFEYLEEDFEFICKKLDIKYKSLPFMKNYQERRRDEYHYADFYNEETRQLVYNKHINIIESFGYKFNDSSNVKNTLKNIYRHNDK